VPVPSGFDPAELQQLLQDPILLAAIQRVMAGKTGLPGLPPPDAMAGAGSAEEIERGGPPAAQEKPGSALAAAARARVAGKGPRGRPPAPAHIPGARPPPGGAPRGPHTPSFGRR
jgi:hypothetical protein